ncbi:MAG: hypothetical protein ACLSG9_02190 [Eubacterium sp.]
MSLVGPRPGETTVCGRSLRRRSTRYMIKHQVQTGY